MSNSESKNGDVIVSNGLLGGSYRRHSTPEEIKSRLESSLAHKQHEHEEQKKMEIRKQIISDVSYENRVVIFIDILGWGKAVDDSDKNSENLSTVINLAYNFKAISEGLNSDESDPFDTRITHFSDSLVISLPETDSYPERIDFFLQGLINASIALGLFIRGGITLGKIYHKENMIFGPALNRAYKLESEHADYPRILLDDTIYNKWTDKQIASSWIKFRDKFYFYDFISKS